MSLKQSFFEAFFVSSYCTPTFGCGISTDVSVNLLADSIGASPIAGWGRLLGADVADSGALHRTLHCHAIPNTSEADFIVVESIKVNQKFLSLPYLYPLQCGEKSKIPSKLDNMRPSGYYALDPLAMVPQIHVLFSDKELAQPADKKWEVTQLVTSSSDDASETK